MAKSKFAYVQISITRASWRAWQTRTPAHLLSQQRNAPLQNVSPAQSPTITSKTQTRGIMKDDEVSQVVAALGAPDFKAIEPHLLNLDKHLTLRSYIDGYTLSDTDKKIWITLRSNKVANAFLKKGSLVNLSRWFSYVEETHPEIQAEIKVADDAVRQKKAALSKAGASYNIALQDVQNGVVTRFPPEPSYVTSST